MFIAHVALWTPDLDRAVAFWTRHFGAEAGPPYRSTRRVGFCSRFLTLGDGARLELMTGPWIAPGDDGPGADRTGWAHIAVSLGSEAAVRTLADRLAAEGLLVSPPRRTGDGYYEAVVRDPDGTLVEITV
ncbi:VOC family protein [Oleisolibacter albus]|uniref:VOC family protein n=1 Tax=Oleisolibacter albus TaxID=2171757 RepID=UPI000DF22DBC|nr:VOC family protein [Oleisolibacter albus]